MSTSPQETSPAASAPSTPTGPAAHTLLRAELNQLIEPNDVTAGALMELMGAAELLALIRRVDHVPGGLARALAEHTGLLPAPDSAQDVRVALARWRKRLTLADGRRALETMRRRGGGLIGPEDPQWPGQLDDLGYARPLCLWWRAEHSVELATPEAEYSVSIVGSRDASDYGIQVTAELVRGLGAHGFTIISGGAYGIDAAAHRAALAQDDWVYPHPPTLAILAGGADRMYPAGNQQLLRQVMERGVVFSEVPPGSTPTRFRFLNRNRLIAAFSRLTIITEARHRSGALNTAGHAIELGREVAAVPGSVFSPNSAGCHRLLRSGAAALVATPGEALELLGVRQGGTLPVEEPEDPRARPIDQLPPEAAMVYESLSYTRCMNADEICARSGIPVMDTLRALGLLERLSLVAANPSGWRLLRQTSPRSAG